MKKMNYAQERRSLWLGCWCALFLCVLASNVYAQSKGKSTSSGTGSATTKAQQSDIAQRRAQFLDMCRNPTPTQRATLVKWAGRRDPYDDLFCRNTAVEFFDRKFTAESRNTVSLPGDYEIRSAKATVDLSVFQHITTITEFEAPMLGIADLRFLVQNTGMRVLLLSTNKITNLKDFSHFKKLETLDLSVNPLEDNLEPLAQLNELKVLHLSLEKPNGFSNLKPLQSLSKLKEISIATTTPLGKELSNMRDMEALILRGPVSDVCFLNQMSNLTFLSLSNNSISDFSCIRGLNKITTLNVADNPIKDITPFLPMPQLRALEVSRTLVEDLSPFTGRGADFYSLDVEGAPLRWCSPKTPDDIRKGVSCLNQDGTEKPWWKRLFRL
jgi:hypothetical protein